MGTVALPPPGDWAAGSGIEPSGSGAVARLAEQYQSAVLATAGLVSYWPLNSNINDLKSSNHGYIYGGANIVSATRARGAGCVQCDGSNDYLDLTNAANLQITGALSIEFWFKATTPGNNCVVVSKGGVSANSDLGWAVIFKVDGKIYFDIGNAATLYSEVSTSARCDDNVWHHCVCTYQPSVALKIYIDGGSPDTASAGILSAIGNKNVSVVVGKDGVNSNRFYPGYVDDFAMYNTVLSAATVAAHFAAKDYPATSPVIESPWIACPYKTLSSVTIIENMLGGAGSLRYQYALNSGAYNGSWLTQAALNTAIANATVTNPSSSLRIKAQLNSDGTQLADLGMGYITATDLDYPLALDVRTGTPYALGSVVGTLNAEGCDYPAMSDVRQQVAYANGSMVGTARLRVAAPEPLQKFQDIEEAIIGALKASIPAIKTVESWAGQVTLDTLPLRLPAAFVAYGGSGFSAVDGPTHRESAEFTVIVAARSMRGDGSERTASQGAYALVQEVLSTLTNEDFGYVEIERLSPARVALLSASGGAAVYGITFQTGFDTRYSW